MTTRRNIVIVLVQKHIQIIIGAISVMALARLVSPAETGIFSVGVAVTALTHAIRDFGVGNFLIREAEPSDEKIRSGFTISLLIALVLGGVLFLLAGPAARFYGSPEITDVIRITTLGLIISPFSTVQLALLTREKNFAQIFRVTFASTVANVVVAVPFAWFNHNAIALAYGGLASSVATVLATNVGTSGRIKYGISFRHWRSIVRYGAHSTVAGISEQIGGRAPDLVVGRLLGMAQVGILSRANSLITLAYDAIIQSTAPVILATMAADHREGREIKQQVLLADQLLSSVLWPFLVILALYSHAVVYILFGSQWLVVAPYLMVLAIGSLFGILPALASVVLVAAGRIDLLSRYSLGVQLFRIAVIILGASISMSALVWLLAGLAVCQAGVTCLVFRRVIDLRLSELVAAEGKSAAISLVVAAGVYLSKYIFPGTPIMSLGAALVIGGLLWLVMIRLTLHPLGLHIANTLSALTRRYRSREA